MSDHEEAHFYFTMKDFENLILDYGPEFVLDKMPQDVKALLLGDNGVDRGRHEVSGVVGGCLSEQG